MEIPFKAMEVHPEDRDMISRLATLQDMHDQVLDLRTLLPQRLWNPILATIKTPAGSQPSYSPSALYTHLTKTAEDGYREMAKFKAAWHSTDMQELWGKTKAESFPQGTDTWKMNYRTAVKGLKQIKEGPLSAVEQPATLEEEPKDVVENFRTNHPASKLELYDEVTVWPLTLVISGMAFEIERLVANDAKIYQIGPKAGKHISNFQQEIVKIVQQRKQWDSLAHLLDMLASYDGMRTRACHKCLRIIDDNLQFALVRESNRSADAGNGAETPWLAYHQKCA